MRIRCISKLPDSESIKGFTLVEVLVAMSIGVMLMGFVAVFMVQAGKTMFKSTEELRFNNTLRKTFASIQEDVREASVISVYSSFDLADRDTSSDVLGDGTKGNLLVLLTFENNYSTIPIHDQVTKIVGYYMDPATVGSDGSVKIYRWETEPASGVKWYGNPSMDTSLYIPSTNISLNVSFDEVEDYFASITAADPSITEIARIKLPSGGIFTRSSQSTVNLAVDTLFGNESAKMLQSISLSFSSGR